MFVFSYSSCRRYLFYISTGLDHKNLNYLKLASQVFFFKEQVWSFQLNKNIYLTKNKTSLLDFNLFSQIYLKIVAVRYHVFVYIEFLLFFSNFLYFFLVVILLVIKLVVNIGFFIIFSLLFFSWGVRDFEYFLYVICAGSHKL